MMSGNTAVIIGGGIGGLTCALLLAKQGRRVALIEQQHYAGGCCTSFTVKGFTFDACVNSIGSLGEGEAIRRIMADELKIWDKVGFYEVSPMRRNYFPDFTIDVPATAAAYAQKLAKVFPSQEEGLSALFLEMDMIYRSSVRSMLDEGGGEGLIGYVNMSYHDLLAAHIDDQRLRAALSTYSTFFGLPADKVSVIVGVNTLMHYLHGGAFAVKGGFQRLADVMVDELKRHGAAVVLADGAVSIEREEGGYAVTTQRGACYHAKHLISNIPLTNTIAMMRGFGQEDLRRRLEAMELSGSFVLVYLGIRGEVPAGTLGPSCGFFSSYDYADMLNCSGVGSFGVSIPSLQDPDCAPPGCSTLIAHWPTASAGPISMEERQRIGKKMVDHLGQYVPDLNARIVYQSVSGPQTIERYTGNTRGAAYGWSQGRGFFKNLSLLRGLADGFHLVGHWSGFGGGIMPVVLSAKRVATTILKQEAVTHEQ